jgi:heat shock protein HslJ
MKVVMMKTKSILLLALTSLAAISNVAVAQRSSGANPLSGTSWQLVRFQAADERTITPNDKSKYTITFGSNGRVTARVDCNRASSTWTATANNQLQFGSWSRTSAKCGPGSLHDQIVQEGGAVHKFEIKDGHLFLSGGGSYYELERVTQKR